MTRPRHNRDGQSAMRIAVRVVVLLGVSVTARGIEPLRLDGRHFVDQGGHRVALRGCNLGNWLLLEPWMLGLNDPRIRDQHDIIQTLVTRFGRERADALLDRYRSNWMTPREFALVKSFGFNLVRIPFHYSVFTDKARPFELREDAFKWLDRAVEWAADNDLYVILDLHGAPGGQSVDMPSGRVDENRLWTDAECQRQMVWLWERIAERYGKQSAVIAYDLVNEPFGDFNTDIRKTLFSLSDRVHDAIRKVDPDTLILVPGTTRAIGSYKKPSEYGWTNVGYTEHFYPGLFGNGSASLATHGDFLSRVVPARAKLIERLDVPYLVGEFNVVFDTCDQPGLMRRYFDAFAEHGWMATMWSLRILHPQGGVQPNNWYLATNAQPFTFPDVHTASADELATAFNRLGSMELAVDEELRQALTAPTASPRFSLPACVKPITAKPEIGSQALGKPWSNSDVAAHPAGGAWQTPEGIVTVVGGGSDIWGGQDEFHFVHRSAAGDVSERSWITEFDAVQPYAKAGWMIRADLAPDAPHALVHALPNGVIRMAWRAERGGVTNEKTVAVGGWPLGVGIERRAGQLIAHYTDAQGAWHEQVFRSPIALGDAPKIGMAVLSHDDTMLASARFRPADSQTTLPPVLSNARNALQNGSFEEVGGDDRTDRAKHWNTWGNWLNRETGWSPTRTGACLMAYHHFRIESAEGSGWYQDVEGITPGALHTFSVWANRDVSASGKFGPESIELRLEHVEGDRVWQVASQTYNANDIASGEAWSLLSVTATIPGQGVRALIVVNPSRKTPRDAALKFDDAALGVASDGAMYTRR